jgi:hypothetical protein
VVAIGCLAYAILIPVILIVTKAREIYAALQAKQMNRVGK